MSDQLQDFLPSLPKDSVGIDDHVARIMNLADARTMKSANTVSSEAHIIVIYGIGGVGKTTLAKAIYRKLVEKFSVEKFSVEKVEYRSSFLEDIRETIESKGMKHVQSLHCSNLSNSHEKRDLGNANIQDICEKQKVIIFLDDVDRQDHLDNLIGGCNFALGSWIIITCRDKALLNSRYKGYELKEMNRKDSLILFSQYAFKGEQPPIGLKDLSNDIVVKTGGLPLALAIIGSYLKGKDESIWKEMLEKLKVPHMGVQQTLKISYDSLEYEEQQMFLDIACFFNGINKRFVAYLWKDLQYWVDSGLERMIDLSLVKIDDNKLTMHDHLGDLGKAIACPANKKPWECSRLWDEKAITVQRSKEENRNIEALRLDKNGSDMFMKRESFQRMPFLKFLHLSKVDFVGDFKDSLSELRWLKWEECPDSFEATNVHLENLIILDLSGSYISENWRGWSSITMERLKVLDLSRCYRLKSTPNLSAFRNLEMLFLKNCSHLEEIDPSIGDVKHLVSLNLSSCQSLKKLPEQLGELKNLEELAIDETDILEIPPCMCLEKLKRFSAKYCYDLQQIPSSIGKLGELVELDLSLTRIKELPECIGDLNKLKILRICCTKIERLPSSIGKLQSLQEFDAGGLNLEGEIRFDEGGLSSLKTLDLRETNFSGLPENLDQLSSLEHLDLLWCDELQSLPKPPVSLSYLQLTCRSNELPSLSHIKHLKELSLHTCKSLQSIPELPSCIRMLRVNCCPKFERLPNLSGLEFLSELDLAGCYGLKELDGLEALKSLRSLNLSTRASVTLSDFLPGADILHAIRGLEKLGSLEELDISWREHIQVLDLSKSEHLKWLKVSYCKSLVEIRCPSKVLERFDRYGCESLKKLPDFLLGVSKRPEPTRPGPGRPDPKLRVFFDTSSILGPDLKIP
ncbi:hypothetical protein BT93_C0266 [Corymbia citriodora subsp. variegata]|nr:hypothetical protein BT93_C0266 [Corymbia citriodora subsp. variegata]